MKHYCACTWLSWLTLGEFAVKKSRICSGKIRLLCGVGNTIVLEIILYQKKTFHRLYALCTCTTSQVQMDSRTDEIGSL